jgi:hypothetical protein
LGSGKVHIKHLTREFTRGLFPIATSVKISKEELRLMKTEILSGFYDPWHELYKESS